MYGKAPSNSLANRPASRSGSATSWGKPGAGPQPPMMVPPKTGLPPGTARVGPPGTAAGRPGTTMKGVNVYDRPTTQQGLGGMRVATATGSGGRMIKDKSYYMTELKQRVATLSSELNRLNAEHETSLKENANTVAFEKKADKLSEELKEMQGELGDFNTLVDKVNTNTDLEEVDRQYQQLKAKNMRESHVLDDLFVQRQHKESIVRDVDHQIQEEKDKAEALVQELEPEKRSQYHQLKQDYAQYAEDIISKQNEINDLKAKVSAYQLELKSNPLKQKAMVLHERLAEAKNKKLDLELALDSGNSESAAQEKTRLLEKVKEDNMEISGMERKINEFEETMQKMRDQILQLDQEIESGSSEKNAKYEELVKRDKEMTAFLEAFEDKKSESMARNEVTERSIVELLENIRVLSKADDTNLPSSDGFKNIQGDLLQKEKEIKNSEITIESILAERDKRIQDLEKVNQLESKLFAELEQLNIKMSKMTEDRQRMQNIEEIKAKAEQTKIKHLSEREFLQYQRDSLHFLVQGLSDKFEGKRKQLNDNETYTQLSALEQKLRHHESNNFHLKEYINSKTAESDYKTILHDVQKLTIEINQQLAKLMSLPPTR